MFFCMFSDAQVLGIAAGRGTGGDAAVRSVRPRAIDAGVFGEAGSQSIRGKQAPQHTTNSLTTFFVGCDCVYRAKMVGHNG